MKPFSEAANSEMRVEFAARRRRQLRAIGCAIGIVLLGGATRLPANPLPLHLSATALRALALAVMAALTIYSLVYWRCPACSRYLGRRISPRECPSCGAPLSGG